MEEETKKLSVFFRPRSVAIVGATKRINKAGHVIFKNFVENKMRGIFKGELYAVNPTEDSIMGYRCYPSVTKIPGEVELIVVVVPAAVVSTIMEDAAAKKVKDAVIITSGFGEVGNHELEQQIIDIAKNAGIRVLAAAVLLP